MSQCCVVHFQISRSPSFCFLTMKRAQTRRITKQIFSKQICLRVSTFPPRYHMCVGGNNTVLCCSFRADRMFLSVRVRVCNCTSGEKTDNKCEWVTLHEGFWRLIPQSIFWCAWWITRRVWLCAVCLLQQLMFPLHLPGGGLPKSFTILIPIVIRRLGVFCFFFQTCH